MDNADAVNKFIKKHKFNFLSHPVQSKLRTANRLCYPATVVIDAIRIVRFMQVGGPDIGQTLPRAVFGPIAFLIKNKTVSRLSLFIEHETLDLLFWYSAHHRLGSDTR